MNPRVITHRIVHIYFFEIYPRSNLCESRSTFTSYQRNNDIHIYICMYNYNDVIIVIVLLYDIYIIRQSTIYNFQGSSYFLSFFLFFSPFFFFTYTYIYIQTNLPMAEKHFSLLRLNLQRKDRISLCSSKRADLSARVLECKL